MIERFKSVIIGTYPLLLLLIAANWCINVLLLGSAPLDLRQNLHALAYGLIVYVPVVLWRMADLHEQTQQSASRLKQAFLSTQRIFWVLLVFAVIEAYLTMGTVRIDVLWVTLVIYLPILIWRLFRPKSAPDND